MNDGEITRDRRRTKLLGKATRRTPAWLVQGWASGKSAGQIARETGKPVKVIFDLLKEMQKSIVEEMGTGRNES